MIDGAAAHIFAQYLSNQYDRDWRGTRPPINVVLPDGIVFCPDAKTSGQEAEWLRDGPTVAGTPPEITIRSKIVTETYSGHLTKGVFSDDDAGRTYVLKSIILPHTHLPTSMYMPVSGKK